MAVIDHTAEMHSALPSDTDPMGGQQPIHAEASTIAVNTKAPDAAPDFPQTKKDKPRPHSCNSCGRAFTRREHLMRHERSHTKEKPFVCPECKRCFARCDYLLRHQEKVHKTSAPPCRSQNRRKIAGNTTDGQSRARKDRVAGANSSSSVSVNPAFMRPRANIINGIDPAPLQPTAIFQNPSSNPIDSCWPSYRDFPPNFKQPSSGEPPAGDLHPPAPVVKTHEIQQQIHLVHIRHERAETPSMPNTRARPQQATPQKPASRRTSTFTIPALPPQINSRQRQPQQQQQQHRPPLLPHPPQKPFPQSGGFSDSFSPPPPSISPYSFNSINYVNGFWSESVVWNAAFSSPIGSGEYPGPNPTSVPGSTRSFGGSDQGMPSGRGFTPHCHSSLSASQQIEPVNILEADEINNFLGIDMSGIGETLEMNTFAGME